MAEEPLEPVPLEEEEGGPVKTFLEHLEDLRWVLIKIITALLLAMVTCLAASPFISDLLMRPMNAAGVKIDVQPLGPIGPFVISMKMALYGGLTLALPFILFFIGQFVLPAMKKNEKTYFLRAFIIGGGLFVGGILLCYFVILPISLKGLVQFSAWMHFDSNLWRAEEYFQFVILFMIGMGLSFEIPVVFLTLVKMGIIPHEWLLKGRSYFFIANLVICSFITPDAVSTIFMVVPVQILMEICILISKHWERQKRVAEAAALASAKQLEGGAS
jgi:sec-independent protein translocase protein TatC